VCNSPSSLSSASLSSASLSSARDTDPQSSTGPVGAYNQFLESLVSRWIQEPANLNEGETHVQFGQRRVSPLERELAGYLGAGRTVEEAREAAGPGAEHNPAGMASTTSIPSIKAIDK
jgi:hypothetical protein